MAYRLMFTCFDNMKNNKQDYGIATFLSLNSCVRLQFYHPRSKPHLHTLHSFDQLSISITMSKFTKADRFVTPKPKSSLPIKSKAIQLHTSTPCTPDGIHPPETPSNPEQSPLFIKDLQFAAGHTPHPVKSTPSNHVHPLL